MNINELKEIVENAPEGATHIDSDDYYIRKLNKNWLEYWWNGYWNQLEEELLPTRSLEDIRTIIELYEQLDYAMDVIKDTDPDSWSKDSILEMLARFSNE